MLFVSIQPAFAKGPNVNPCSTNKYKHEVIETNVDEGYEKVKIADPKKFVEDVGFEKPFPDAQPVEVVIKRPIEYKQLNNKKSDVISEHTYVTVTSRSEACGTTQIRRSTVPGPSDYTMTVSEKVTASFSANVGVSAEVVSAGVGFTVTDEFAVSDSYKVSVPSGATWTVVAYPNLDVYRFDVYEPLLLGHQKTGSGTALKPVGVCFVVWK